jgi:hypothetical protein
LRTRRLTLSRLAPFQGRSADDHEGLPLVDEKYGVEEAEKKYAEWDKLMQQLFVRRK